MKTAELTGAELDYWVAKAEGREVKIKESADDKPAVIWDEALWVRYHPSSLWQDGGPIVERERIALCCVGFPPLHWRANAYGSERFVYGDSPLIAAMRAFVSSKFGDGVEA